MQFRHGGVFLKDNVEHSFENALLIRGHFSRIPQIGLMSVARFSWVPNLLLPTFATRKSHVPT